MTAAAVVVRLEDSNHILALGAAVEHMHVKFPQEEEQWDWSKDARKNHVPLIAKDMNNSPSHFVSFMISCKRWCKTTWCNVKKINNNKNASGCRESLETDTCMHAQTVICTHTFVYAAYMWLPPFKSYNAFYWFFHLFFSFSFLDECWFVWHALSPRWPRKSG